MKEYTVYWTEKDSNIQKCKTFYSLTNAKTEMKNHIKNGDLNVSGNIYKIYSDGCFEPCGRINLKGSNAIQMSNMTTAQY